MTDIKGVQLIDGVPCISTGGLNDLLPYVMQGRDIESWGFTPKARIRAGLWWAASDVPAILDKVAEMTNAVREQFDVER